MGEGSKPCGLGRDGITERRSERSAFILASNLYLVGVGIPFERHDQTITPTVGELREPGRARVAWRAALVSAHYHTGKINHTIRTIASTDQHVWLKPMRSARPRGSGRR
jgi:hypothetical protein